MTTPVINQIKINRDISNLYPVYNNLNNAIQYVQIITKILIEHIKSEGRIIDGYVIHSRGTSGVILATLLFQELVKYNVCEYNIYVNHIRKPNEMSHQDTRAVYIRTNDIHIIIDDFTSSGNTIQSIIRDNNVDVFDYIIIVKSFNTLNNAIVELNTERGMLIKNRNITVKNCICCY